MPLNQRQQQEIIAAGDAFGAAFANHVAEQQPAAAAASTGTGSTSSRGTDIRSDAAGKLPSQIRMPWTSNRRREMIQFLPM